MKSSSIASVLAPAAAVNGQWFAGGPECAHSCLNSFYSSATAASASHEWPSPAAYCSTAQSASIASCLSSACSATPTAFSSYSQLSSSLCSRWSSCEQDGSTRVQTLTAPFFTASGSGGSINAASFSGPTGSMSGPMSGGPSNSPGQPNRRNAVIVGDGPGGPGGNGGFDHGYGGGSGLPGGSGGTAWPGWNNAASNGWTGGVYTVTGCTWDGPNPWGGGPGGWGGANNAWGGWGDWGAGWTWSTQTTDGTVTATNSAGSTFITSGSVTLAQAVSGSYTSTHLLEQAAASNSASASASSSSSAAAPGSSGAKLGVKVLGGLLGVFIGMVTLL